MNDWKTKQIKQLGRVVTGKTPPKVRPDYFGGNELFVSPKDFDWNGGYVERTQTTITEKALCAFRNQVIPRNAVLFTCISFGFGKIAIASRQLLTNQQINSVIANENHHFRFVYYLLRVYTPVIYSFNSGIDTPIVPKSVFEKIEVKCPELELQRKIAAILTAYDDLIEANKRRIALLERMAEEIYREWFVRMRFPGYQNTKFVKGLPEGWEIIQFGQIANMIMGQSPKSEFYNDSGQGLPFHQGVGTYGDRFPRNITFCTADGRKAKKGDILFSVRAPVGRLNIANCELIIGRGIAAIRQKEGKNSYLYYLLRTMFANEDIIGNGSIFNSVGKDELSRFVVLRHPDHLTARFEKIALPIDQQIEALIHSNSVLTKTRDLLLPRLISGKISVADLDIQFPPSMCEEDKDLGRVS